MAKVTLIYARSNNGIIGNKGKLPWHLPEDMAHFKQMTMDGIVIMGHRTWESLSVQGRPLPGRINLVLTRQKNYLTDAGIPCNSLERAIKTCAEMERDLWVIGGAEVYAAAVPYATHAVVTEIHVEYVGDAYAPTLGVDWVETQRDNRVSQKENIRFDYVYYTKTLQT